MLLSAGQLAKELGVHIETIRRWDREGKIKATRTSGGDRRFDLNQVKAILDNEKLIDEKATIIYARVSTPNRKDDLNRQIKRLENYCTAKGWEYKTISDIGSGINYRAPLKIGNAHPMGIYSFCVCVVTLFRLKLS